MPKTQNEMGETEERANEMLDRFWEHLGNLGTREKKEAITAAIVALSKELLRMA